MKHKNKLMPMLLGGALLTSLVVLTPNNSKRVEAYDKEKLATTINLNDVSDESIRNYYSNLNSLSETERQGNNLLKNLKGILKNGQKYYSYDANDAIWQMYEIIDRDWNKSPATSITQGTYDASTKTITGYSYGSNSNKKDNPYVRALYVDRSIDNPKTAWTVHDQRSQTADIEREHIWPKGHGFETKYGNDNNSGARGDPMHLWAADGYTNGIHNNYFYGNVDKTKEYKNTKDEDHPWNGNNYFGYSSKFTTSTTKVFEPQDSDKGDIARACFYMVARYNYLSGSDADGIDSNNPNLELVDNLTSYSSSGYESSTSQTGKLGLIQDLLEWNKLDPVDEFELHRNNLLFNNYTNNRNPFIDFPEWADLIWGADKTTKSANPASDDIARPQDFVPPTDGTFEGDTKQNDSSIIPGVPDKVFFIICGVVGAIVLIVIIVILLKGSKKQKKAVKKIGKKLMKSPSKSKKR